MTGGYVMNIQNFSVNDGEGIRTNIFLSGCPLRCRWCSNPEGQTLNNSMTSYMTAADVIREIKKQLIFYRYSGGGVTFSGGEATVQQDFLRELATELYGMGVSLAIETCGEFVFGEVSDILKLMDLIFLDIKHMDDEKHREYTGVSNKRILENAVKIAELKIPLVIRIPVIHNVNTDEKNIKEAFEFIKKETPLAKLELLPYHTLGEEKYRKLHLPKPSSAFQTPSKEEIGVWNHLAQEMGITVVSYK